MSAPLDHSIQAINSFRHLEKPSRVQCTHVNGPYVHICSTCLVPKRKHLARFDYANTNRGGDALTSLTLVTYTVAIITGRNQQPNELYARGTYAFNEYVGSFHATRQRRAGDYITQLYYPAECTTCAKRAVLTILFTTENARERLGMYPVGPDFWITYYSQLGRTCEKRSQGKFRVADY